MRLLAAAKLDYRASVAQWKAELVARRPKTAKLAANEQLREYVQERLSGQVRRPDGTALPGPAAAPWKGRNKPHRQDRRWATAWSPEQISSRLEIDFPDDESDANLARGDLPSALRAGPRRAAAGTHSLLADRQGAAGSQSPRAWTWQGLCH